MNLSIRARAICPYCGKVNQGIPDSSYHVRFTCPCCGGVYGVSLIEEWWAAPVAYVESENVKEGDERD